LRRAGHQRPARGRRDRDHRPWRSLTAMTSTPVSAETSDDAALDAYSRTVVQVAERLLPWVASLRHGRGNGSAVILSSDGLLLTSAHVVAGSQVGTAVFHGGAKVASDGVGHVPLSALAVVGVP